MKTQSNRFICIVLLIALQLFSLSCKRHRQEPIIQVDPSFGEYVAAYTTGLIPAGATIVVKLSQPTAAFTAVGKELETKLFDFSPAIKGKAFWVNDHELEFRPQKPLNSGQYYNGSLKLNKLFDISDSHLRLFEFSFRAIPQSISLYLNGLMVQNADNPNTYNLEGEVITADFVTVEDLQKCITAEHNGRNLVVKLTRTQAQNTFNLLVEGIERESKAGKVSVAWTAKPIGGNANEVEEIDVPELSRFVVCSSRLIQAPNQCIILVFSDLLDKKQVFDGLVDLQDLDDLRFEVERNQLRIYPTVNIGDNYKLTVNQGVKNFFGDKLDDEFISDYVFEDIKPAVRAAGRGVILPTSEGLIFPFEAVNLRSVLVEILRIYETNVPYYLQDNKMGETDQLNRVGLPVLKKVVALNQLGVVVPNRWQRYALDLKQLFVAEPGALYRIKISFTKQSLLEPCDGLEPEAIDETIDFSKFTEPSYFSDYSNAYQWGADYDWNLRDNPCNSAYYSSDRILRQFILSSDIGIIAKLGNNGQMLVAVNSIPTAKPISGASVRISDFQNQTLAKGSTNADGLVTLELDRTPFLVTVKHAKQVGYLRVDNASSNSLSNFDVGGLEVQKGLKGFIYGERDVWRPGDTIHLAFMVEDKEKSLPAGHPIVFELTDARGITVKKMVKSHNDVGIYYFPVATQTDAATGNWLATIKLGSATFTKTIKVETIKPNRLKINFKLKDDIIPNSGQIDGNLGVKWLHGAIGANLKANYEMTLSKGSLKFDKYSTFDFDDPSIRYLRTTTSLWEGETDQNGAARVYGAIDRKGDLPAAINVQFKGRVFEPGGNFSIDMFSKIFRPYRVNVGVRVPMPEGGVRWLETDKEHEIALMTLDNDGNPLACNNLIVEIYKATWSWWWEQASDDEAHYVSSNHENLVERLRASTDTQGKGSVKIKIKYPNWGRYLVKVINRDNGNSCGTYIYVDWPSSMAKTQGDRPESSNILSLATDKLEYRVNEDIKLTFPGAPNARALISIENGSRIVSSYWVDAANATNVAAIRVLPTMTPNVYVHVTLLQPHADKANDLPIRMFGIIPLKVTDPATILKPVISMADELKSESKVDILVREQSGKKMNFTLAVVDEGLLDITRFHTPDPYSVFYAREAIGVKTWDLYNDVMGAYGGKLERLLSIGGDESLQTDESGQVLRFKPVVRFFGPFTVQSGRSKKIEFDMPSYAGSVRVMVVAANNGAYGFAEKTCPVQNDIMLISTLPRVLGPNEDVTLPVNLFVANRDINRVRVKVETSDNLQIVGKKSQGVPVNDDGENMLRFNLKVSDKCGPARVQVTAEAKSFKTSQVIDIDVRNPLTPVTRSIAAVVNPASSQTFNFSTFGIAGSNSAQIEIATIPPLNLSKRLKELISYPHGCLEQTVSRAFPQIYLKKLVDMNKAQETDLEHFVSAAIAKIARLQNANGGFRFWPSLTTTDEWSTSYAGHFLLEARNNGFDVPNNVIDRWIAYQRKAARRYSPKNNTVYRHQLVQAYRLYTLALAKKGEVGAMNKLKEQQLELPAKMRLAQAYALIGQKNTATKMLQSASPKVDEYQELGHTFGSSLRDRAIVLETMLMLKMRERAFPLALELGQAIASDRWLSTHETAVMLVALAAMDPGDGQAEVNATATLNGKDFKLKVEKPILQANLNVADGDNVLKLNNLAKQKCFANIAITGIPTPETEQAFNKNLTMTVHYELNDGTPLDPAAIDQGVDFVCVVTIANDVLGTNLDELALTQIFPSGWEIQNERLDASAENSDSYKYRDIRDDRVLTYFDLHPGQSKTFKTRLTATYAGRFYMPGPHCEAMYNNSIAAAGDGAWVTVE